MDDLISRQAALDARCRGMKKLYEVELNSKGSPNFSTAVEVSEQKTKWIPRSERLPSEGENVLLCDARFGNVAIGRLIRYNTSCCWEVDHWDCDIEDWQAWMPLPEPYREEMSRWLVCRENCGGCHNFDGFGCDRSPIIKEGEEKCRCDGRKNSDG